MKYFFGCCRTYQNNDDVVNDDINYIKKISNMLWNSKILIEYDKNIESTTLKKCLVKSVINPNNSVEALIKQLNVGFRCIELNILCNDDLNEIESIDILHNIKNNLYIIKHFGWKATDLPLFLCINFIGRTDISMKNTVLIYTIIKKYIGDRLYISHDIIFDKSVSDGYQYSMSNIQINTLKNKLVILPIYNTNIMYNIEHNTENNVENINLKGLNNKLLRVYPSMIDLVCHHNYKTYPFHQLGFNFVCVNSEIKDIDYYNYLAIFRGNSIIINPLMLN